MLRVLGCSLLAISALSTAAWTGMLGDRAELIFADATDTRPVERILLIGNSRTSANDLPIIVRRIADSAEDSRRFDITVQAINGSTMESQWNNRQTRQLLAATWDEVIIQGESRGQSRPELAASFETFGEKLLMSAHPASGPSRLIVNWAYDPGAYQDGGRAAHFAQIEAAHHRLGADTGARLIDVGRLWEQVRGDHPEIPLTRDFNHPSVAGSYLVALAIYSALADRSVAAVNYTPSGMSSAAAAALRKEVDDHRGITG